MPQLGETVYVDRSASNNGNPFVSAEPFAGNISYGGKQVDKGAYESYLSANPNGKDNAGNTNAQLLSKSQSNSGIHAPGYIDPTYSQFQANAPTPSEQYFTPEAKAQSDANKAALNQSVSQNGPLQTSQNQGAAAVNTNTPPQGLSMPTGAGSNTVFDPISGKQVSPAEAAFNQTKASGQKPPQDSSSASDTVSTAIDNSTPPPTTPTTTPNVDNFFQNNESVTQQAQDVQNYLSPQTTTDTLTNELSAINADKTTLNGLNTQYMNIQNIMSGTEDDIRKEIQAAGGMATNSQVMALTTARNKTLLQQAKVIQQSIANQKNIIANDTSLYNSDKTLADKQYTERSSALKMAEANQKNVDTAAKSTYSQITKQPGGYAYLYAALNADPQAIGYAENALGLQSGQLEQLAKNGPPAKAAKTPTVIDVTYDAQGNKITTKNGQVTSTVSPKPKAPLKSKTKKVENINSSANITKATNKLDTKIQSRVGKDGYISPEDYKAARNAWISDGHPVTTFNSKFNKYANPADLQDYRGT